MKDMFFSTLRARMDGGKDIVGNQSWEEEFMVREHQKNSVRRVS